MFKAGLLGLGAFVPADVRRNDWWPAEVVDAWSAKRGAPPRLPEDATDAARRVFAEMARYARDPFQGVRERHVVAPDVSAVEIEAIAAERALANASVERGAVDLLLVHTAVPDYLLSNTAAVLHEKLGLSRACLSLQVEASAYSFLAQLTVASEMIASGAARCALLVQSSTASRLVAVEDPASVFFGDAATAAVIGRVDAVQILAHVHRTDGRYPRTAVASVPGGRWYDGRSIVHVADAAGAFRVFLDTVDCAMDVVPAALEAAGVSPREVAFFAVHQGTPWLRALTQSTLGLEAAGSLDLFASTGYVFSSSIPLVLDAARDAGSIREGDLVVLFGGGTGATYGATVMRWPRLGA